MLIVKGRPTMMPPTIALEDKIEEEVRAVEAALKPDVIRIKHEIAEDWADRWAIYFRVLISDYAAEHRLREVATDVESRLAERLDFAGLGLFPYPYLHFRSESEQAALRDKAWA
jgi:hypothetical protein